MSIANYLKRCIPEFQQTDSNLSRYLDVSGEFLGEMKEAIEQFDNHKDWRKGSELSVDMTIKQRGFTLPSNMQYEAKRVFLRDIAEIIKRNGTEEGLIHALKMVGYIAEVRSAWIPCVERLEEGYLVDIETGEEKYYELDREVYQDLLYGEEVVTENGVYFSGYRYYDDALKISKLENIPIAGENYEEYQPHNRSVTKSPYSIIRLKDGDFKVDVQEYTNPITGKVYRYSTDEEFTLVNEILEFFIKNGYRATTIRAIIVAFLQQFDDTFYISENFIELTEYVPDGGDDFIEVLGFSEKSKKTGTVFVLGDIGTDMVTGTEIPYASPLSIIRPLAIGTNNGFMKELYLWNVFTQNLTYSLDGSYGEFLVRYNTSIEFFNSSDAVLDMYGNGSIIATIQPNQPIIYETDHTIHKVKIVPQTTTSESINIILRFRKFDQFGEDL